MRSRYLDETSGVEFNFDGHRNDNKLAAEKWGKTQDTFTHQAISVFIEMVLWIYFHHFSLMYRILLETRRTDKTVG